MTLYGQFGLMGMALEWTAQRLVRLDRRRVAEAACVNNAIPLLCTPIAASSSRVGVNPILRDGRPIDVRHQVGEAVMAPRKLALEKLPVNLQLELLGERVTDDVGVDRFLRVLVQDDATKGGTPMVLRRDEPPVQQKGGDVRPAGHRFIQHDFCHLAPLQEKNALQRRVWLPLRRRCKDPVILSDHDEKYLTGTGDRSPTKGYPHLATS